ncbi:MAG: ATP-binding cassette domain-containing protein [Planctomycetota bacterium]|jgi:branched-chain amino acid transport system ATP-binding protein|nr:ATP-binding cassette domain-containing protein [Planctomycetota bacterium]
MLSARHITTGYGKKQVLTDVSLEVARGEIVILTGGNGSGKSTVLKTIYGLLKPWTAEGKIVFEGDDITALDTAQMIRRGIVYVPQKKNVFDDFTVEENLLTAAEMYGRVEARWRMERVFSTLSLLSEFRKRMPFKMSGGERQMLAFANALIHSPKIVLFDEPFAGVDEKNSYILTECICNLNTQNTAFVIIEHRKPIIEQLKGREIKLNMGKVML